MLRCNGSLRTQSFDDVWSDGDAIAVLLGYSGALRGFLLYGGRPRTVEWRVLAAETCVHMILTLCRSHWKLFNFVFRGHPTTTSPAILTATALRPSLIQSSRALISHWLIRKLTQTVLKGEMNGLNVFHVPWKTTRRARQVAPYTSANLSQPSFPSTTERFLAHSALVYLNICCALHT